MGEINLFADLKNQDEMLRMEHITKIYDNGFIANNDINFEVKKGEIHGLVGENGAGKTTLMKILFGQEIPEQGSIYVAGKQMHFKSPLDALHYGIGMVHQHFMLVDNLSVLDNMVLGQEPTKGILYDRSKARKMVEEVSKKYELEVDPDAIVGNLSVGLKQRVEILKILLRGAQLLLLDEPTAVLTPQETKELFIQLKGLRDKGFSIVFISHKLNEVKEICNRITVLRAGKTIKTVDIDEVSEKDIAKMMVGHNVALSENEHTSTPGKPVIKIKDLSLVNENGNKSLDNINCSVRAGEILGVAGIEGNGQAELADLIAGLVPLQSGSIEIANTNIGKEKSIRGIRELGVSLIHEDRMTYGVSTNQSIKENVLADRYYKKEYKRHGLLNLKKASTESEGLISDFTIKCDSQNSLVKTLSGGNIQKVVAAREFTSHPIFLLACQPTRGIDIGAAELIRNKMMELRDKEKTAVLLFSADLSELLSVSDSIIVMCKGQIVAYFSDVRKLTETELGEYMLGLKKQTAKEIGGALYE